MFSKAYIAIAGVLVALAAFGGVLMFDAYGVSAESTYIREGKVEFEIAVAHWEDRLQRAGHIVTGQELVEQGVGLSNSQAHLLAHALGEAIYRRYGIDGLSRCEWRYGYGCHDQFISNVLAYEGTFSLPEALSDCAPKGVCAHAVGHGIATNTGYDRASLDRALPHCRSDDFVVEDACLHGVFMEYNLRQMQSLGGNVESEPRKLDPQNPYDPCLEIPREFQLGCAYELPVWWWYVSGPSVDPLEKYRTIGELCVGLPAHMIDECFRGSGFHAVQFLTLDVEKVKAACEVGARTDSQRNACLIKAAVRYRLEEGVGTKHTCTVLGVSAPLIAECEWTVKALLQ